MAEQQKTPIVYETILNLFYDLEKNEFQRRQMLFDKIPVNAPKFGGVAGFREVLLQHQENLRLRIDPIVIKWFTLKKQIDFLDKCLAGEIPEFLELNLDKIGQPAEESSDV